MSHQAIFTMLVLSVALADTDQAVPHQELVEGSRKERGRDVDQDADGSVSHVSESLRSVEDQSNQSGSEISGQIRGDGDVCKSPDHVGVGKSDYEWRS